MSTLYIRLPSRSVADNAAHWITLSCPYALASAAGAIERVGHATLSDLAPVLAAAQRVVLLLAASDVTLLHLKVPPMPPGRLRLALPNLVEDQLMSDPADCVMVAGADMGGTRTVAVMQRQWLQILLQTVTSLGVRNVAAVPSQLCLAQSAVGVAAAVTRFGEECDLTLRLDDHDGLGLPLLPEQPDAAPQEVIETLCALVPTASIALHVAAEDAPAYQHAAALLLPLEQRVTVLSDTWSGWIDGARSVPFNLVLGLAGTSGATLDWRRWRWPLALATLLLLLNIVALNVEWFRLAREARQLRMSMVQTYRNAYPKETVIVDPAAQMRQKIAAAKRDAGQPAPDDFAALAAGFGAAWSSITLTAPADSKPAIASLDYRDRSLLVKPKPEVDVPLAQIRSALAARNLTLAQPQPGVWQIRSEK